MALMAASLFGWAILALSAGQIALAFGIVMLTRAISDLRRDVVALTWRSPTPMIEPDVLDVPVCVICGKPGAILCADHR